MSMTGSRYPSTRDSFDPRCETTVSLFGLRNRLYIAGDGDFSLDHLPRDDGTSPRLGERSGMAGTSVGVAGIEFSLETGVTLGVAICGTGLSIVLGTGPSRKGTC